MNCGETLGKRNCPFGALEIQSDQVTRDTGIGNDPVCGEELIGLLLTSEKREVTGSTPVPTTGKVQFRGTFRSVSFVRPKFRARYVPNRTSKTSVKFRFMLDSVAPAPA